MGLKKKDALGPNPLSVKKSSKSKGIGKNKDKPRRKRQGKRSTALSLAKKMTEASRVTPIAASI